jgi:large subunit ribosomal protein L25
MPEITLTAESGRRPGSSDSRRLRADGKIPGVVYGHGIDPIPVAVDARSLRGALSGEAGLNALLNLEIGGEKHLALAKTLQRHPVKGVVTHVDFQVVGRDEVMTVEVPVNLVGEAKDVVNSDGVVAQELFSLTVQAKPGDIPNAIDVDISSLEIGQTIRVADLTLPAGSSTDVDPDHAVVVGQSAQVSEEDLVPEAAEGAEPIVEGAEAEGESDEGEGEAGDAEGAAPSEPEASE